MAGLEDKSCVAFVRLIDSQMVRLQTRAIVPRRDSARRSTIDFQVSRAGNRGATLLADWTGGVADLSAVSKTVRTELDWQQLEQEWGITSSLLMFSAKLSSRASHVFVGDTGVLSTGWRAEAATVASPALSDASLSQARGIPAVVLGSRYQGRGDEVDENTSITMSPDCASALATTMVGWCNAD